MQLSLKREILSNFFFYFVNLDSSLDILKKKDDIHSYCDLDLMDTKRGS